MDETGISWNWIAGHNGEIETIRARWMIYWAVRKATGMSFPMMARILDRDRTTIIHGCKKADKQREISPQFREFTDRLVAAIADKEVPK